jgi:hypothetical protein
MPFCCNSAPRKKLPPPTTMATPGRRQHRRRDLPGDLLDDVGVDPRAAAAEDLTDRA